MNDTTNPFEPPKAHVSDNPHAGERIGGSLATGIAGQYDFNISDVLKEAWEKTNGLKGAFWGAGLLLFAGIIILAIVVGMVMGTFLGAEPGEMPTAGDFVGELILQLVITAAIYPFMVGIIMMGVKRSVDRPISFNMLFAYFGVAVPVIIAGLLISVLTWIGFLLLILPGIYLSVAYALTVPLIGDKNLGAWQAMEASRKAITKRWFKFFGLFIAMIVIILISMIPLGIGLIWTYPMGVALLGILYRDVFGVDSV